MKKMTRLFSLLLVLILCLSVLPMGALAASGGWQQIEGDWYYIENGAPVNGWKKINGTWYYLVPEWGGIMLTGWLNTDPTYFNGGDGPFTGDWYHFSSSGAMEASKWVKETYTYEGSTYTDWYYMLSSGKGASGWQKIGGVWYYFDPDADDVMVSGGMRQIDGKWYYFKDSGALYTGWKELGGIDGDGNPFSFWAYFTSNGAVQDAWKKINGSWYYFEDIVMLSGGLVQFGDYEYYYFKDSGAMATGWQKLTDDSGETVWLYFTSSGAMKMNGWQKDNGSWYYFQNGGYYAGGLYEISGKYYYFKDSGAMFTGWKYLEGAWRYFGSYGMIINGEVKDGGKQYYIKNGAMLKNGWGPNARYYGSDGVMLRNTSRTIDGTYYTFDSNGTSSPFHYYDPYH